MTAPEAEGAPWLGTAPAPGPDSTPRPDAGPGPDLAFAPVPLPAAAPQPVPGTRPFPDPVHPEAVLDPGATGVPAAVPAPSATAAPAHPAGPPEAPRNVPALLRALRREQRTGTVHVFGAPGGAVHLRGGRVAAITTPGAPGVESLLLRSGRIDEDAWNAARTVDPHGDGLGAALVDRGLLSAADLEVVCAAAVFDGAFAMALGGPAGWELRGSEPAVLAGPGVEPEAIVRETARRIARVSRAWGPPADLARTRLLPGLQAERGVSRLPERLQAVLTAANGRRTSRDLAFALGRGLYAVMLDVVHLAGRRLLLAETRPADDRPSTAPRRPGPTAPDDGAAPGGPLPQRDPGRRLPTAPPGRLPGTVGPSDSGV